MQRSAAFYSEVPIRSLATLSTQSRPRCRPSQSTWGSRRATYPQSRMCTEWRAQSDFIEDAFLPSSAQSFIVRHSSAFLRPSTRDGLPMLACARRFQAWWVSSGGRSVQVLLGAPRGLSLSALLSMPRSRGKLDRSGNLTRYTWALKSSTRVQQLWWHSTSAWSS